MANRTLSPTCLASLMVAGTLSLGCDLGPSDVPPPPPPAPAPAALSVTGLSPATGWTEVTTGVVVAGTGFVGGSRVLLDGVATDTSVINSTTLVVRMPPRDVGTVDVAVVNPGGAPMKAPQPFVYIEVPLVVFADPGSGFSTSEVRDAQGQVVQFDQRGRLIWKADGARLTGFTLSDGLFIYPPEQFCQCWFEIRFGTEEGQRRAYLTADWGHDNPGTLLDLDVAGSRLLVSRSQIYPPGTFTLAGVVTEETAAGIVPVSGAWVYISAGSGWRESQTDANGAYEIRGLSPGGPIVFVSKTGYRDSRQEVSIAGHTTYNIGLVVR